MLRMHGKGVFSCAVPCTVRRAPHECNHLVSRSACHLPYFLIVAWVQLGVLCVVSKAANYGSGEVAVYPVSIFGVVEKGQVVASYGEGSRAHCVTFYPSQFG